MSRLIDRFHNLIWTFLRGEDGVCVCTCGRNQEHHVVPYSEDHTIWAARHHDHITNFLTMQELDMMLGLLVGIFFSLFVWWLHCGTWRSWFSSCIPNQLWGLGFRSWVPRFSYMRELFRHIHPTPEDLHTESEGALLLMDMENMQR